MNTTLAKTTNDGSEAKRGIRKDKDLYDLIVLWQERSATYIKERGKPASWDKNQKLYENDLWGALGRSRANHLTKCNVPVAFDAIETGLPIATSRTPKPDVQPLIDYEQYHSISTKNAAVQEGSQEEQSHQAAEDALKEYRDHCTTFAQKMQRQLIDDWNDSGMPEYNRQMYRQNGYIGNAIVKSVWDSKSNKITNTICDIRTIFPTPGIDTIKGHVHSPFIYAPVMPLSDVRRIYGIDNIEPDAIGEYDSGNGTIKYSSDTKTGWLSVVNAAMKTAYNTVFKRNKDEIQGNKVVEGYCQVYECYMPDDSEEEYQDYLYDKDGTKIKDADGSDKVKTKIRNKYSTGHKVVTVIKNNPDWIIAEEPNNYKYGLPPFFEIKNNAQANDFYGISDLEMLPDIISCINLSASNFNDNLRLHGNPIRWELINSKVADDNETTNEIGKVVKVKMPNAFGYVNPPNIGFDVKWWMMEFLFRMVDRVTKLSDAVRGFNAYATDSGKKVRELRMAATGSFQPKLDAHVNLAKELYRHWAYIHQHFDQRIILQKNEDEFGESNYEEFNPMEMADIDFKIEVSSDTIMPNDPTVEFEEALALFDRGIKRIGSPLISPEHLIDLAPTLEDKARAKKYIAQEQERDRLEQELAMQQQARAEASKQFADTVNGILQAIEAEGLQVALKNQNFDILITQAISATSQFPELLKSQEFAVLPPIVKTQILTGIAEGLGQEGEQQQMPVMAG